MPGPLEDIDANDVQVLTEDQNQETQQQPTHDLKVEDVKHTNIDLDKALNKLAGLDDEGNKTDPKSKVPTGTPATKATAPVKTETQATVQPVRDNSRDFTNAFTPRAYGKAFKVDAGGNVLNASGEVVARAGAERKSFERMLPVINGHMQEAEKYRGMYESAVNANSVATNLKLTPEEYGIGARIMAAFKSDPKKAINFLLSEAQNNGIDVSDIGNGGGAGLSMSAIEAALEKRVAAALEPFRFIVQDRESSQAEQETRAQANSVIQDFMEEHPDASIHQDAIAAIMHAKPNTPLSEAYWILNAHAAKHNFDWSKPLAPQAQEWMVKNGKAPANAQIPAATTTDTRRLPTLNGRQDNGSAVQIKDRSMPGSASSNDIVKEAMLEAGMDISRI